MAKYLSLLGISSAGFNKSDLYVDSNRRRFIIIFNFLQMAVLVGSGQITQNGLVISVPFSSNKFKIKRVNINYRPFYALSGAAFTIQVSNSAISFPGFFQCLMMGISDEAISETYLDTPDDFKSRNNIIIPFTYYDLAPFINNGYDLDLDFDFEVGQKHINFLVHNKVSDEDDQEELINQLAKETGNTNITSISALSAVYNIRVDGVIL